MLSRASVRPLARLPRRPVVVAASALPSLPSLASPSPVSSVLFSTAVPKAFLARNCRPLASRPQLPLLSPTPGRRTLSDHTRQAIDRAVASAPVVLFMKGTPELPQCGFSRAAIQILGMQGVDPAKFSAFNVLEDPELRAGIKEYSDWPTIPQLYVDGEFVGGCDILIAMHQGGDLAKLFEEKGVLIAASEEGTEVAEEKKE